MFLPRVSVVIVTWNALELLQRCLPSVTSTDYPDLEIIIADNGSTDGSAEWIASRYPDVTLVRHPENWLFCKGNNAAFVVATGKYVVLLNNDVETPPGWLHPLVRIAEADETIAAVQPKVLQFDRRDLFEYAGASGGFLDRLGYPFARGRIVDCLEPDVGQYDDVRDIDWGSGAALLLRREALQQAGPLDERFEMHMEEIDLCWRLRRMGYRIVVEPRSHVFHVGGGSLPVRSARKLYFNFRNNLLMLYKNLPARHFRRVLAERLCFDAAAACREVLCGRPRSAAAVVRAWCDANRLRRHYCRLRPERKTPETLPTYRGSVLIDRYVRGLQRFSDLPEDLFRGN